MLVIRSAFSCLLCLFSLTLCLSQDVELEDPPGRAPDRIVLSLTQQPEYHMGFNWRTMSDVTNASVEISKADASPNFPHGVKSIPAQYEGMRCGQDSAHYHGVRVRELLPNTQYMYRVGDSTTGFWSEWSHFKTARLTAGKEGFSFLYLGDAQNDLKSMWSRAIRAAFSTRPDADFIFHAGDLVDEANNDAQWGEWFYGGGWINRCLPTLACTGNHEYSRTEDGTYALSKYWGPTFTFPRNGPRGLDESTFFIDYQNTRFVVLNTQAFLTNPEAAAKQTKWLKGALRNHEQKWLIVMMHHPVYSSKAGRDNLQMRSALIPLFEKHHVDLVLQGHDHTYGRGTDQELSASSNVLEKPMYVVSVSGPKMYDLSLEEWMMRGAADVQLYQLVEVNEASIKFSSYLVTGELYDAFELHKMNDGRNIFVDNTPADQPELLDVPMQYQHRMTKDDWKRFKERFAAYKKKKEE